MNEAEAGGLIGQAPVNDREALACATRLADVEGEVLVEPLANLPVLTDLVVEMTGFFGAFPGTHPILRASEAVPGAATPEGIDAASVASASTTATLPSRRRAISAQIATEADAYNRFWDDVLVNLDRAVSVGLEDAFWFDRCPLLDELRGSRRFEALRATVRGRADAALRAFDV